MKRTLSYAAIGAAGLAVGLLAGRGVSSAGAADPARAGTTARTASPARQATGPVGDAGEARDLAALLKWRKRQESGSSEVVRELERLDAPALRALMLETMAAMAEADDDVKRNFYGVLEMAAKELFRRDREEALDWAAGIEGDQQRKMLLSQIVGAAAQEDPELAKPWIDRFGEEFGKDWATSFAHRAIIGATGRGAEDLIRLKELYGDDLRGAAFPQGAYAEGFDFHRLITALGTEVALLEPMQYWAAKDKEAAWAGVKQIVDEKERGAGYFGSLFSGVAVVEGEEKAAAWVAPKLAELPESLRLQALQSLRGSARMSRDGVEAVMAALPQAPDRVAFAAAFLSPHSADGLAVAALRGLASDASREEALVSTAGNYRRGMHNGPPGHAEKVRGYFAKTAEEIGLSAEARTRVMAALEP